MRCHVLPLVVLSAVLLIDGVACSESAAGNSDDQIDAAAETKSNDAGPSYDDQEASFADASANDALRLPPDGVGLDYQLGGSYAPPDGVGIVARDREAAPEPGFYNICYVNGFQAQEQEAAFWLEQEPDLLLRDDAGRPVIDPDWSEMLLDVRTVDKRTRLAEIIGGFIRGCGDAGFDAVEIDNLDTFTRSGGRIKEDDAVLFMQRLSTIAHGSGLAVAQKNSAEVVGRLEEMGTDFAVAEECNRYSECDSYTGAYGRHVLVIEYRRQDFDRGCKEFPELPLVLRDCDLVAKSESGYLFASCPPH